MRTFPSLSNRPCLYILHIMAFLCLPSLCHAAACSWAGDSTATAASASRADVAECLNDARWGDGDTLILPAAACGTQDWSAGNLTISKNNVTLRGQGYNSTCISNGGFTISAGVSGIDISGIKFFATSYTTSRKPLVLGEWAGSVITGVHIHGCSFSGFWHAIEGYGLTGVIANNVVDMGEFAINGPGGSVASNDWTSATNLGNADSLFIEDNYFTDARGGGDLDHSFTNSNSLGSKIVIRCNRFVRSDYGNIIDFHGGGYGSNARGPRKTEIYGNILSMGSDHDSFFQIRGGTGVVFSNMVAANGHGFGKGGIRLWNDRVADGGTSHHPSGSASNLCALWTSGKTLCTSLEGYACCDQIGRGQNQALEPFHFWNNKYSDGAQLGFYVDGGAAGATYCTDGVDYKSNTQMPGYTPYTYPHPLRGFAATTTCLTDSNSEAKTGITYSSSLPVFRTPMPPVITSAH